MSSAKSPLFAEPLCKFLSASLGFILCIYLKYVSVHMSVLDFLTIVIVTFNVCLIALELTVRITALYNIKLIYEYIMILLYIR